MEKDITFSDSDYLKQKKRIKKYVEKWVDKLCLNDWKIDLEYHRIPILDQSEHCIADCTVEWQYVQAIVRFNILLVSDLSDEYLEEVVVHEFCHILLGELSIPKSKKMHQERVVTLLSRLLVQL